MKRSLLITLALAACNSAPAHYYAHDGDSLIIEETGENLRLVGIDAPELPGSPRNCSRVHCPTGSPYLAKWTLDALVNMGAVTCVGSERDRYNRRLVTCYVDYLSQDGGRTASSVGQPSRLNINAELLRSGVVEAYRR